MELRTKLLLHQHTKKKIIMGLKEKLLLNPPHLENEKKKLKLVLVKVYP